MMLCRPYRIRERVLEREEREGRERKINLSVLL